MAPKSYELSEKEQSYLEDGTAPGSYRPHELENRIEEKVERLPDRFRALFDDIELLNRGYFDSGDQASSERYLPLATDSGYHAWLDLMGFDEPQTKQAIVDEFSYTREGHGSAPARFGAHLGQMVNRLMRWPDFGGIEEEDIVADLVWGFLRGLTFDNRAARDVTEDVVRDETADILQQLHDRAEIYAESTGDPSNLTNFFSRMNKRRELREQMARRVGDILMGRTSGGTCPVFSELVERDHDSGDTAGGLFYEVVDHLADKHLENDDPVRSTGQWFAFCKEHEPLAEFDVEEYLTEQRVLSIVQERRLVERVLLRKILDADAEVLAEKSWRGVSASRLLPVIIDEESISSKALAKTLETSDYEGSVTGLAKQLAGQDSWPEGVTVFVDRPLLHGDASGWQPTRYGRAALHALRVVDARDEKYAQPIELSRFPEKLLVDALDEIGPSAETITEHASQALDD